jgi:hemerythrin
MTIQERLDRTKEPQEAGGRKHCFRWTPGPLRRGEHCLPAHKPVNFPIMRQATTGLCPQTACDQGGLLYSSRYVYLKLIYNAVMRSLKWNSSHAVFVTEIDDDHRQIFDAVAQFQAALCGSASASKLNDLTERLAVRIEDHFAHEERLMRAARCGLLSWHKRCHDAARKRVARLIQRIGRGDPEAGAALVKYLSEWLQNHTRLPDKMLGAFLRNQRRTGKIVFTVGTKTSDSCEWLNSRGERFDPTSTGSGF